MLQCKYLYVSRTGEVTVVSYISSHSWAAVWNKRGPPALFSYPSTIAKFTPSVNRTTRTERMAHLAQWVFYRTAKAAQLSAHMSTVPGQASSPLVSPAISAVVSALLHSAPILVSAVQLAPLSYTPTHLQCPNQLHVRCASNAPSLSFACPRGGYTPAQPALPARRPPVT